jgi:hypothetical protein
MTTIKISSLFNFADWNSSVIFKLFNSLSKKKIEYVDPDQADILIIGPYDINSVKKRSTNFLFKKLKILKLQEKFPNLDIYSFKRNYKPLRIFFSFENFRYDSIKADYYITSDLGVSSENHLRFPSWKDYIDWSVSEDIYRDKNTLNSYRFGSYWNLDDLIKPLGEDFLRRKKEFCIFTSHLVEPRKSIYLKFSKNFNVDGYGPYFNKSINNHNSSEFKTQNILKDYAFNLCPQNSLYPGYYTEGLVNAFVSKTLPVTWADKNINLDFNEKSFINLLDYTSSNYDEICQLMKDQYFLKKFVTEPLLLQKPDLKNEKLFVQKILSNL